jgi:hypothetical protein
MSTRHLPVDTWLVVEHRSAWKKLALVSRHQTQTGAEAARDNRNQACPERPYRACLIVEPVAQRMGGHRAPTARKK